MAWDDRSERHTPLPPLTGPLAIDRAPDPSREMLPMEQHAAVVATASDEEASNWDAMPINCVLISGYGMRWPAFGERRRTTQFFTSRNANLLIFGDLYP